MASVLFPKTFQEIIMGYSRSFQQEVSLLSLEETVMEANFDADKENPLMRLSQGPRLFFLCFQSPYDHSILWTHGCPLGVDQSLYLMPPV